MSFETNVIGVTAGYAYLCIVKNEKDLSYV